MNPFFKWIGGKRRLLPTLEPLFPPGWLESTQLLYEPFLGGGAMFWKYGAARCSYLQDANEDLVQAWTALRDTPTELVSELDTLARGDAHGGEAFYYSVREKDRKPVWTSARMSPAARSARFLYIIGTGYNGIYRVNASGTCNTPWGDRPFKFNRAHLLEAGRELNRRNVLIRCSPSWRDVFCGIPSGFVFLDPPYVPLTPTANFAAYTAQGFNGAETLELLHTMSEARVPTMMCNHNVSWLRAEAWARGMWVTPINASRSIRPSASKTAKEIVITNYAPEAA